MRKCICFLIILFFSFSGFAQEKTLNLSFKFLSPDDGLSQGTNAYVFKDSRGFVWISSLDGLNRFDGVQVKIYKSNPDDSTSLFGQNITSQFYEDVKGNLWFTTNEAINCYQRATDNFRHFQLCDSLKQLITEDYYAFHLDNNNQFWLRTGLGKKGQLHIFNIATEKDSLSYPIDGHRCNVVLNEKKEVKQLVSSMFFTRPGIEIIDLEKGGGKKRYLLNTLPELESFEVFSRNVFVENDSTLWIGSVMGLIQFNPKKGIITDFIAPYFQDKFVSVIWSVIPFQKDFLFVGTLNGGILLFNKISRKFIQQFKHNEKDKNTLNRNTVRELYLDNHSNLWVARYENGIAYTNLYKQKFSTLETTQGQRIYALFENEKDNSIWIGLNGAIQIHQANGKILKLNSFFLEESKTAFPLSEPCTQILQDREQNIWALLGNKALKYDAQKQQFLLRKRFPGKAFFYTLKNGKTLSILNNGITIFDENEGTDNYFNQLGDYQKGYYTNIFEDQKEQLYFSKNATDLLIFSKNETAYQLDLIINNIGYCHHFFEESDKENLWVATSTGLLKINTQTLDYQKFNIKENGLPNEVFHAVIPDKTGKLWLSSNQGIIKFEPIKKSFHKYTFADGLQGYEFVSNLAIKTKNDQIWMGGAKGLNIFNPEKLQEIKELPNVQFTNLLINDEIPKDSLNITELSNLNLSYEDNTISLEFVALEYSDAPNNQFKYQLLGEGYNQSDEWIDNKNRRFLRFPNLPLGDYRLNLKAANSDGYWNERPKSLAISISPPFWQTWWFYLLSLLAISSIIYTIFQYRLQQALKVERMRVKISSDLHDDVGGLLSGLAMQSEILELTAKDAEKPKLRRISELSRSAMSRMRDTVWAIDARKDEFEHLLDRMREHAEETLMPKEFRYEINTKNINLKSKLPTEVRQNLYLIFKEAITNIAKHSNGNFVKVVLENRASNMEMMIQDNGIVQQKEYKTTGLGLSNMKMRATKLNGTLKISTEHGFMIKVVIRN